MIFHPMMFWPGDFLKDVCYQIALDWWRLEIWGWSPSERYGGKVPFDERQTYTGILKMILSLIGSQMQILQDRCDVYSSVGPGYNSGGNILKARQAVNLIIRQSIDERVSHVKSGGYKGANELLCSIYFVYFIYFLYYFVYL